MKNDTKKTGTGTKTATAALAEINAEIEALNQKRIALAEPLKARYAELRVASVSLRSAKKPHPGGISGFRVAGRRKLMGAETAKSAAARRRDGLLIIPRAANVSGAFGTAAACCCRAIR